MNCSRDPRIRTGEDDRNSPHGDAHPKRADSVTASPARPPGAFACLCQPEPTPDAQWPVDFCRQPVYCAASPIVAPLTSSPRSPPESRPTWFPLGEAIPQPLARLGNVDPSATMSHMERIGVRELRRDASAVLRRVAAGETVEVTDRGRPVAVLLPTMPSGLARLEREGLLRRAEADLLDLVPVQPPVDAPAPSSLVSDGRDD